MSGMFGFDAMSTIFPIFFFLMFGVVLVVIIFAVVKSVSRGIRNQNSPILTVDARIVAKRTETGGGANDTHAWTRYYATFEVASGDRMEFMVDGEESGMLAEGDEGKVTFQGTRYISFMRKIME